ncbi:MAG: hypothetical protein ABWZ80_07575 [Beijerinckiaceae bacterium]
MAFQIVEQKLSENREPVSTKVWPERFDQESRAEVAIKVRLATADHAGYDEERKAWWARNDDGTHIRYFTQETSPSA